MSYRITFNKPMPIYQTEEKLDNLSVKIFDYGSAKFFSYNNSFFELEEDPQNNIIGLTIHGNSVSDYHSLMNVKDKLTVE